MRPVGRAALDRARKRNRDKEEKAGEAMKNTAALIVACLSVCFLLAAFPRARETGDTAVAPKELVGEARTLLRPALDLNGSVLSDSIAEDCTVSTNGEIAREKVLSLVANALVHAPAGAEIAADFDSATRELTLWVENRSVALRVRRSVTDTRGNTFTVEMIPRCGTLYRTALRP